MHLKLNITHRSQKNTSLTKKNSMPTTFYIMHHDCAWKDQRSIAANGVRENSKQLPTMGNTMEYFRPFSKSSTQKLSLTCTHINMCGYHKLVTCHQDQLREMHLQCKTFFASPMRLKKNQHPDDHFSSFRGIILLHITLHS